MTESLPKINESRAFGILFFITQLFIGIAGLLIVRTMDRVETTMDRVSERVNAIDGRVSKMEGRMEPR
jgi:hypothetical protein